jgi:hypothetical protein
MDRHALAVLIPVVSVFFTGLIVFSFTRLGRAVAKRIEGGSEGELADRLARLEIEQDRLMRDLADAHERLDYAERIIARDAIRTQLPDRQAATPVP